MSFIKKMVKGCLFLILLIFLMGYQVGCQPKSQKAIPDENGLFSKDGSYSKALKPYNEKSILHFAQKIDSICETYLAESETILYSIIPDKGYFIPNTAFSEEEYTNLFDLTLSTIQKPTYIPIQELLELSDYYQTDLHWRQEKILDVADTLAKALGFSIHTESFTENLLEPYQGVYAPYFKQEEISYETLIYLTNELTDAASVEIYGELEQTSVYCLEKWDSQVPYDLFLSGPLPYLVITNPYAQTTKELLIFGDSFASSLAPLLLEGYSSITLIDLRFVSTSYLSELIEFHGQDVLFLYHTAVINNSYMLK